MIALTEKQNAPWTRRANSEGVFRFVLLDVQIVAQLEHKVKPGNPLPAPQEVG